MEYFGWASMGGALAVVLAAALLRGLPFAIFGAVLLAIQTSVSVALAPAFAWCFPLYAALQVTVFLHLASLVRASLRPALFRALVSLPASWFIAGSFLAAPWAVAAAFGLSPRGAWIPYLLALVGLSQSLWHRPEEIDLVLEPSRVKGLARHPRGEARVERPLRLVQISDPHLGPFMSEDRLAAICRRAVEKDPDLVLLTGDFLTMESHGRADVLSRALAPLAELPGRVFACNGNHDHEAPETVARAMEAIGATLLIDQVTVVQTRAGAVQIVGMDFHFRDRKARMDAVLRRWPREVDALRLVLLHDPGAFKHLADGEADLVLSGHTHGGQLGLLSLGLPHTIVSALGVMPDHGFWAGGTNRLYVHRGTGHYGFPLRLGVPGEESLVRVHDVRT